MTNNNNGHHISDFTRDLVASGKYHFTTKDACIGLGSSVHAVRAALSRIARRGDITSPFRGFYVIVPPEYRSTGCLPAPQFIPQLAAHIGINYYVALLSAAEYHGAAHQRPQVFQVMVEKNRKRIECGSVKIAFIARKRMSNVATMDINTPRGFLCVSTSEATALDCIGYPGHCGGLSNVAGIIAELAESMKSDKLVTAAKACPISWVQRLGYILELVGAEDLKKVLASYVAKHAKAPALLDPYLRHTPTTYLRTWKLLLNKKVQFEK
ncbi:MAG: hypothetical protein A2268_15125 [Candidatus Raymondbacteria bacterium RifOxyA12_full_50_37]|nr:MAG: hypothetical protein A2268_15125 [Candidatus Raymondbacteria bacterium RifOxyA12_full_50_37]OGJ88510.1 MAG: hypothetical protein A2248_20135 [Candidatus Raymondbacteria bacterium RIFOXYA2_FULL_49_16]OGJ90607.1 MAG: hypothetical protein A2350_18375 [Candidatus Raymondbacteria bacterium RifOxyB12_full_50_8]OGJ98971.1 MAG: hypothetical protein A2453_10855 [Candidatus Raymondbacteria bacterium RIFOXYC2_FULL_50_21]OGK00609.1 MAG: hypothetical protein A2487_13700 [Candidatus Raymondbacteria b